MTDAFDTATSRVGVCRDFAHLMISFCRALGRSGALRFGLLSGLGAARFSCLGAGLSWAMRWYNIDATYAGVREALVPIAFGRDAADVPMTTLFGNSDLNSQTVEVSRTE